jgi:hypothetical protein
MAWITWFEVKKRPPPRGKWIRVIATTIQRAAPSSSVTPGGRESFAIRGISSANEGAHARPRGHRVLLLAMQPSTILNHLGRL